MYKIVQHVFPTVLGTKVNMCHRLDTNDRLVILSIMIYDEYKTKDFKYNDGDVFIDIGSHIGTWSIMLASINPTFKIYAYEPVPENVEMIKRNININNFKNIEVFEYALTSKSEKEMPIYYTSHPPYKFVGSPQGGSNLNIVAEAVCLDDIFTSNKIDRVKMMKVDCEGCECKAFQTISPENLQKIDYVVGEFHPWGITKSTFLSYFQPYFLDVTWKKERLGEQDLQRFLYINRRLL